MRLEIDIPEHHYNNIMALDTVNLGRVPYKGIIMYTINAIKHGRVLEQEPFINKPCVSSGVCEHDKQNVLDKIRAEIEFEVDHRTNMLCAEDVFGILDKHKAESEPQESEDT